MEESKLAKNNSEKFARTKDVGCQMKRALGYLAQGTREDPAQDLKPLGSSERRTAGTNVVLDFSAIAVEPVRHWDTSFKILTEMVLNVEFYA